MTYYLLVKSQITKILMSMPMHGQVSETGEGINRFIASQGI
jgi:hypothetical protein